jgi:hypothetical protein
MDIFFIVDILLTFFSSYLDPKTNRQIFDLKLIAIYYLKTSFVFDFFAAIPFSTIELIFENSGRSWLSFAKMTRVYRIVKIFRLMKFAKLVK